MAQSAERLVQFGAGPSEGVELARRWRSLNRVATAVALVTSPALYLALSSTSLRTWECVLLTIIGIAAFRGLVDVWARKLIPWPNLFGADQKLLREDVVARRRSWSWRKKWRLVFMFGLVLFSIYLFQLMFRDSASLAGAWNTLVNLLVSVIRAIPTLAPLLVFYLFLNVVILIGPFLLLAIRQIRTYEPGDADWGVRLDHVRGQAEAKAEVKRVIDLWQQGEAFEQAGGKRERGLLFLGPPGTGKTMLAKAIATGFNSPFVTVPGSGFAGMFIGMDILSVQYLAWKAKRVAAKWGGQCIVFIDEIDAVGMRRASLGSSMTTGFAGIPSIHDFCWHGPAGSISSTCGLVLQNAAWGERIAAQRAQQTQRSRMQAVADRVNAIVPGMMGGMGSGALNQLLVTMDGIDEPPMMRRFLTRNVNGLLDALYFVPQRIGRVSLRLPRPKPAGNQVYFIGACNVPIESLDPALTRPGRMGRHIRFRTPIKEDREDILDFYLGKVAHEAELDSTAARDEVARMTNGYSPAMIEQVCSMALTYAHHDGRLAFSRHDLVEAMTTIESGMAIDVKYVDRESRAVAIHEAGHAVTSYLYRPDAEAARLSIRMRGGGMLGHHYAIDKEERFSRFRSEEVGNLVVLMGAIAAEMVFYGENSNGVFGDMQSATVQAAIMAGFQAMGPERIEFNGHFRTRAEEEQARERIMKRFEEIGNVLLSRGSASADPNAASPVATIVADPVKRRAVTQILGQSYFVAFACISHNRAAIEQIADVLCERRELHGDEVTELLDECRLEPPTMDYVEERTWPRL
jgi:ATP-dependent Zn protease